MPHLYEIPIRQAPLRSRKYMRSTASNLRSTKRQRLCIFDACQRCASPDEVSDVNGPKYWTCVSGILRLWSENDMIFEYWLVALVTGELLLIYTLLRPERS